MSKVIEIDLDLWKASKAYVLIQIETMRRFGELPKDWGPEMQDKLTYDCAVYPQKIRNMQKKIDKEN